MTNTTGRSGRETVLRRVCLVAVVAPLTVIATSGLLRPEPPARNILSVPSAAAADPAIPDVPDLPDAVEEPASVSNEPRRDSAGLGVLTHPSRAAVEAVPGRALTAYQRAETVMRQADPGCQVTWQLIAAIGQVESNHGRFGGALMTADGVVHPAILGPRLTGSGSFSRIDDTDAGLLDGDRRFDRAVGPMQFIPSTWTVVGVDADGDGRRDPQDIDDASLATGVYLCSGDDDLATRAGQRAAVYRYNHSESYVDLVIGIMAGYLHADPSLFDVIGASGTGVLDPSAYPYPTGGGTDPTPYQPQPTFEVVNPTGGPSPTGTPTAQPTSKPTATVTETATPIPTGSPTSATPTTRPPTAASPPHQPCPPKYPRARRLRRRLPPTRGRRPRPVPRRRVRPTGRPIRVTATPRSRRSCSTRTPPASRPASTPPTSSA